MGRYLCHPSLCSNLAQADRIVRPHEAGWVTPPATLRRQRILTSAPPTQPSCLSPARAYKGPVRSCPALVGRDVGLGLGEANFDGDSGSFEDEGVG